MLLLFSIGETFIRYTVHVSCEPLAINAYTLFHFGLRAGFT